MTKVFGSFALYASLMLLTGCGGGSGPTGTVSGTVTKDGKPVAAQVSYKGEAATASAVSDPSTGSYTLMSGPSDRIPVGTYQVAVSPVSTEVDTQAADYAAMMEGGGATDAPREPLIPQKYASFGSSGLMVTVTEGANTFDIELE